MDETLKLSIEALLPSQIDAAGIDCVNPINDEFSDIDNPELVAVIDNARAEGIDARVIVQYTIGREGYDDIEDFTADFAQYCQVSSDSIIFAISDDSPRAFDVLTAGRADAPYQSGRESQELIDEVRKDLQNDGTSYQADASDAIEMVLDHIDAHENVTTNPVPITAQPGKDSDISIGDILVPVGKVGVGLGTAALLAAGSVYVVRRINYGKEVKAVKAEVKNVETEATFAVVNAENELAIFRVEDAQELRSMVTELEDRLNTASKSFKESFLSLGQKKRLMRRPKEVSSLSQSEIEPEILKLKQMTERINAESERVKGLSVQLPRRVSDVAEANSEIQRQLSVLRQSGFDTTYFDKTLNDISVGEQRISALIDDNYIERPHQLAVGLIEEQKELQVQLLAIPSLQENLQLQEAKTLSDSASYISRLDDLSEEMATRSVEFHGDFSIDIDAKLADVGQLIARIKENAARVADTHNSKDVAVLFERERLIEENAEVAILIDTEINKINTTLQTWEDARDTYSVNVDLARSGIDKFNRFAEENSGDVEPETVSFINGLTEQLSNIEKIGLAEKPQYLELQQSLLELSQSISNLQSRAFQEQREMVDMRNIIDVSPRALEKAKEDALNFATGHRGDVSSSVISGLNTMNWSIKGSSDRNSLRRMVQEIEGIHGQIKEYHETARSQYERAESERREEEDRRRRAAASAAAAARRRSSSSSSSFGGGGGHRSGGFGGGGGHKSGGF
jgi:uncharacterized membrane protein YgcG